MTNIVGIDIGTSTLKLSRRSRSGAIMTERLAQTPPSPLAILQAVERLLGNASADVVALSSFRRALIIDDHNLVLARSSPSEPIVRPRTNGQTDALNPMAPIHRWVNSVQYLCPMFQTFDVWLSERLTGQSVCAESQAWLTGAWDTSNNVWDEAVCVDALLSREELPEVLSEPLIVDGVCLPVLGDHEATALACASAGEWPLHVVECGTALACMMGGDPEPPERLGLESPVRCGYLELVDPHFLSRINGVSAPAPTWMTNTSRPSATDVVTAAVHFCQAADVPIILCGGNVTRELIRNLTLSGLEVSVKDVYTSSAGALVLAERAISADP